MRLRDGRHGPRTTSQAAGSDPASGDHVWVLAFASLALMRRREFAGSVSCAIPPRRGSDLIGQAPRPRLRHEASRTRLTGCGVPLDSSMLRLSLIYGA